MIGYAIGLLIGLAIVAYCDETQALIHGPRSVVTSANLPLSRRYAYFGLFGIILAGVSFIGLIPYLDGLA